MHLSQSIGSFLYVTSLIQLYLSIFISYLILESFLDPISRMIFSSSTSSLPHSLTLFSSSSSPVRSIYTLTRHGGISSSIFGEARSLAHG